MSWETKSSGCIVDSSGNLVALICPHPREDENTKLLTAAPDLLKALRYAAEYINWEDYGNIGEHANTLLGPKAMLDMAVAAIKKATS